MIYSSIRLWRLLTGAFQPIGDKGPIAEQGLVIRSPGERISESLALSACLMQAQPGGHQQHFWVNTLVLRASAYLLYVAQHYVSVPVWGQNHEREVKR